MLLPMQRLVVLLLSLFLTSCGVVNCTTEVTTFHRLPAKGSGETFKMTSLHKRGSDLEASEYAGLLSAGLQKYGWKPSDSKSADYLVIYDYGITGGRTVRGVRPIIGQTSPGGTTYHRGSVSSTSGYGTYSGTSYTAPTYGVIGAVPTENTVYDRYLFMVIADKKGKEVLSSKCFSTGSDPNLNTILPKMLEALFLKFPGVSGTTVSVRRPVP